MVRSLAVKCTAVTLETYLIYVPSSSSNTVPTRTQAATTGSYPGCWTVSNLVIDEWEAAHKREKRFFLTVPRLDILLVVNERTGPTRSFNHDDLDIEVEVGDVEVCSLFKTTADRYRTVTTRTNGKCKSCLVTFVKEAEGGNRRPWPCPVSARHSQSEILRSQSKVI